MLKFISERGMDKLYVPRLTLSEGDNSVAPRRSAETRKEKTQLVILAAVADYAGIKIEERGAATKIAGLTDEVGASVDSDTIRTVLKKIPGALKSRQRPEK